MKLIYQRVLICCIALLLVSQTMVFAAAPAVLSGVRFGSGAARDRIVLDLSRLPAYEVRTENG